MERKLKESKGITLIALVITIIVLLILAGVSIATLTGDNGILTQANNAKKNTQIAEEKEAISMAMQSLISDKIVNPNNYVDGYISAEQLKTEMEKSTPKPESVTRSESTKNLTVKFDATRSNREYEVTQAGTVTVKDPNADSNGLSEEELEEILDTATKHPEQVDSEDIGIDDEGYVVNLDLWNYQILGEDTMKLAPYNEYGTAYAGKIEEDGSIQGTMPAYIKKDGEKYKIIELENLFGTGMMGRNYYSEKLTEAPEIPNTVKRIGYGAFLYCERLTNITIPNSVTYIDGEAFCDCTSLSSIEIPNSIILIGSYAFADCTSLTNITIPSSVTSISYGAFSNCTSLTNIEIPNSVISIGDSAFEDTPWYNKQPDGIIYINNILYKYKGTMPENTNIEIKEGTKSISSEAFSDCTGLSSITIPDSVTSIEARAFYNCTSLLSITIPDTIILIEGDAFDNTAWYNNQPDGVIYINNVLYGYKGTMPENTNIEIKDGVKVIASDAFSECTDLTSITIPNSVKVIASDAFRWCTGLTSITIPSSVTSIDSDVFEECDNLTSITIDKTEGTIEGEPWGATNANVVWKTE